MISMPSNIERVALSHQDIAGAELVDRHLELGPVLDPLARGLLAEDHVNAFGPERAELAVEVLMSAADAAVADLRVEFRSRFVDHQKVVFRGFFAMDQHSPYGSGDGAQRSA
jgi:hypothetical protein